MSNIRIEYAGLAMGATDDFSPSLSSVADFSDSVDKLMKGASVATNPCEPFCTTLDGSASLLKNDFEEKGIWSEILSRDDGTFLTPIVLTLTASEKFSISALTIVSDKLDCVFPKSMHIAFYSDSTLVKEDNYVGDSPEFVIHGKVEFFNKVIITFKSLNLPNCRLRLSQINFGENIVFEDDEITSVKIIQQISPVSAELCITTCDIVLRPKTPDDYVFQKTQALRVYHRNNLIGKFFITEAKRDGQKLWKIDTEDYIGILDTAEFAGAEVILTPIEILTRDIFTISNLRDIPITLNATSTNMNGILKPSTVREALGQAAFASNTFYDTTYSDGITLKYLPRIVAHEIPLTRIMQGIKIENVDPATSVTVTAHNYIAGEESERETVYTAIDEDVGKTITIEFDGGKRYARYVTKMGYPVHMSPSAITIVPAAETEITAVPLIDHPISISSRNPNTTRSDPQNDIRIENATLVSRANIDKVLNVCYNQYSKRKKIRCKVVERKTDKTIRVGELIRIELPYSSDGDQWFEGIVTKSTFSLVGGITIKDIEVE